MGLDIYENQDELINTTAPARGQLFTDDELAIIEPVQVWNLIKSNRQYYDANNKSFFDPYILEFHLYTLTGQWITGNYDAEDALENIAATGQSGNKGFEEAYVDASMRLNLKKAFDDLKIERGQFKYVLNYFRDRIGSYDNRALFVKEISPDRTEVKLNFKNFKGYQGDWEDWNSSGAPFTDNASVFDDYQRFLKWQIEYSWGHPSPITNVDGTESHDLDTKMPKGQPTNPTGPEAIGQNPIQMPEPFIEDSIEWGKGIINGNKNENKSSFAYLALNFGENRVYRSTNWWVDYNEYDDLDNNDVYVKLHTPLPNDIDINQDLWIVSQLMNPYIDNIIIEGTSPEYNYNTLTPNFDIEVNTNTITQTEFKTWNDVLASNTSTTQRILDKMFSGSLASGIDLGLDFTDYKNFIHFSSAKERLANFKYKVELIEFYTSQSQYLEDTVLGSDSGSIQNSIAKNDKRRYNVIGGFDQFERWLYNEPTASLFTHGITGSLTPWPKHLSSGKYVLHSSTSSLVDTWYTGNSSTASYYDLENDSALIKTIPEFIREDPNNDQYELFVNMIAQHFDILYTYVNALTTTYTKEEHPSLGVSKELLYNVAESMGWHLSNGNQAKQLWEYALGTNSTGSFQSTGSLFSKSSEDITHEVWRRIVNNLPYILKTKGTARSINALMSTYGIPRTLLSIREYGGPKIESTEPEIIEDQFTYAVRMESGSRIIIPRSQYDVSLGSDAEGSIIGGDRSPDTIEFRVKPQAGSTASYTSDWQGTRKPIYSFVEGYNVGRKTIPWGLSLEYTGSYSGSNNYGRLVFDWHSGSHAAGQQTQYYVSASTDWVPVFDGDWWNVRMWTNIPFTSSFFTGSSDPNIYFQIQKSADCSNGKVLHKASGALDLSVVYTNENQTGRVDYFWNRTADDSHCYLGGWTGSIGGTGATGPEQPYKSMFTGAFQEYREYMEVISDDTFDIHTLNPTSYVGNNPTSSYYTLTRHYSLGTDVKAKDYSLAANQIISSSHPNQNVLDWQSPAGDAWNSYASASNFPTPTGNDSFNREVEQYYIKTPSIGGNTSYSNKIRLESDTLTGPLSPSRRNTVAAYDRAPIDNSTLGLFYSMADQINADIYNHAGFFEIDDYIGDPSKVQEYNYPDLVRFANYYWKKYSDRNDINAFIKIFSIFDFALFNQIKQTLPARVNTRMGLVIEPNVLERSKVPTPVDFKVVRGIFDPQTETYLKTLQKEIYSGYDISAGSIIQITSSVQPLDTAIISGSNIYEITGNQENQYSGAITSSLEEPAKYDFTNLIMIPSSSRLNAGLISESISQGVIPTGTTLMPLFVDQPFTSSYSLHDPREPVQLYITDMRKSNVYKRIVYHYGPQDRITHYYPLSNFSNGAVKKILDKTKWSYNSEQFVQVVSGSDTPVVISGSQFRAAGGTPLPSDWNSNLFPTSSHNYFTGPMMYFSSSDVGFDSSQQENGREYVQIRPLVMPSSGPSGSWSISFLTKETSGSYNNTRVFIGADLDTTDAHPGTQYPFIGFSSGSINNGLYFRTADSTNLYFSSSIDDSTGFTRTDTNHFIITYDNGIYTSYVNGNKLNAISASYTTSSFEALGSGYNNSGGSNKNTNGYTGLLGQVRFYDDYALSSAEIYWLNLYPHLRANRDTEPNLNGQLNVNNVKREVAGLFTSTSLEIADYHDDDFAAWDNIRFNGSRITGADFNINSTDTPDGGPVVSFTIVNKEAIIAQPKSDRLLKIGRKLGGFFKRNS